MRIIENKYCKEKPVNKEYLVACEYCGSGFAVTKDDVTYGHLGCAKVICPCCGRETYVDAEGLDLTLTADNVKYPDHYYPFGTGDAYKISNSEIDTWVRELVNQLEDNKDWDYACRSCGDTHVSVFRVENEKEFNVIVAKGYAETFIPFREDTQDGDWKINGSLWVF